MALSPKTAHGIKHTVCTRTHRLIIAHHFCGCIFFTFLKSLLYKTLTSDFEKQPFPQQEIQESECNTVQNKYNSLI